jgi:hypothetical protein
MADVAHSPSVYAREVFPVSTAAGLAAATAPLFSSFGDDLTLRRDGNVVHWGYEGQTVVVEQHDDGVASASFVGAPITDEISGSPVSAIYRRTADRRYRLTEDSARAMVSDMIAFFSGEREPFFTFVDVRSLDA